MCISEKFGLFLIVTGLLAGLTGALPAVWPFPMQLLGWALLLGSDRDEEFDDA